MAEQDYHHGDLKRALLDVARSVLEAEGPGALTLREVARRAGVSHNAPYRHFADRDALIAAVAAAGFLDMGARMAAVRENDPAEQLARLGQEYVAFAMAQPGHFAVMFSSSGRIDDPRLMATAMSALSHLRTAVSALMGGDDELAVTCAWSMVHGLAKLQLQGMLATARPAEARQLVVAATRRIARGLALTADPPR
jgi:AcrR family transcriptional regulator